MSTPNSVFETFLRDIEPSATTKSNASSAQIGVRDHLKNHDDFKDRHVKTFLSGSYKRDTAIRPKTKAGQVERPDVDVVVVTNDEFATNPRWVHDRLYDALADRYEDIRRQQRSVGVSTAAAEMDIVPLIQPFGDHGAYYIPDRQLEVWIETNPPKHTSWTTSVNQLADGRFKPLVKLGKWWRRESPTIDKRPKGFVIECIIAECMSMTEKHYGELFVGTFEQVVERYRLDISLGIVPMISDPGVPGNSVTEGISFAAFEGFYNKVKTAAEDGRKALNASDAEKATALWRAIFGPRFPEVPSTTSKAASLLGAVGSARSATFPDRPVRPRKPDGFA